MLAQGGSTWLTSHHHFMIWVALFHQLAECIDIGPREGERARLFRRVAARDPAGALQGRRGRRGQPRGRREARVRACRGARDAARGARERRGAARRRARASRERARGREGGWLASAGRGGAAGRTATVRGRTTRRGRERGGSRLVWGQCITLVAVLGRGTARRRCGRSRG